MNKFKKYICRGFSSIAIVCAIVGGSYAYTYNNGNNSHEEELYLNSLGTIRAEDDDCKYEKKGIVVNVETILNVRQEPSMDSPVDDTLDNGEIVDIVNEEEGWYEIKQNDTAGYVKSDYVKEHEGEESQELVTVDLESDTKEKESNDSVDETSGNISESDVQTVSLNLEQVEETKETNRKLINVELTGYCNGEQCSGNWGGITALGTETRVGVVAAPSSISLGSKLYIPDLSYYKEDATFDVEDRGGAVKMKDDGTYIIDVWFPTHEQALEFGRVRTTAYILE